MDAIFVTLLLLLASLTSASSDDVPVLIWTSDGSSVSFPPSFAGHRLTGDVFTRDYLDRILEGNPNNNVALFIEERLSIEYLRDEAHGEIDDEKGVRNYETLKDVMEKSSSVVLPAVSSAVDELYSTIVQYWTGPVYKLASPYLLPTSENPDIADEGDSERPSLFIVTVPTSEEPLNNPLHEYDDVINIIMTQLERFSLPFVGLYTSHRSSLAQSSNYVESSQAASHRRGRRHLMQQEVVDGSTYLFVNISNCLYLYVENITFTVGAHSWQLPLNPNVSESSYCANYSAALIMNFNVATDLPSLTMTMLFTQTLGLNAGFWYMSNFSVAYNYVNGSSSYNDKVDIFPYFITETPFGFSYSCSYLPQIPPMNITQTGRGINVTFVQLQVQAFNISNDQFGYYNDCVGFFNITIWCVLIVLFVLLIILADGVCMMMSLETSDRVDDPRGKTISVMASD